MSLIQEFREALAIEIEEQKKRGTARWDVRAGRLVEVRGGTDLPQVIVPLSKLELPV